MFTGAGRLCGEGSTDVYTFFEFVGIVRGSDMESTNLAEEVETPFSFARKSKMAMEWSRDHEVGIGEVVVVGQQYLIRSLGPLVGLERWVTSHCNLPIACELNLQVRDDITAPKMAEFGRGMALSDGEKPAIHPCFVRSGFLFDTHSFKTRFSPSFESIGSGTLNRKIRKDEAIGINQTVKNFVTNFVNRVRAVLLLIAERRSMGLDETDAIDDSDGGEKSLSSSKVSCSICLEPVTDNGGRSWAKLNCSHEFHLDCIGSAFNVKGAMQCPNCRKIEKGQWLFATGCRSFPEFSLDDWTHDEDPYELSYSGMAFGVQWCPFTAFPRLSSSLEEGEFPSTAYHDLLGQPAIFTEHAVVSSAPHPCPYFAFYGPFHSSSSNAGASVSDGSIFSNHWSGPSGSSEIPASYLFPAMDSHYHHGWEHHVPSFSTSGSRLGSAEQSSVPSITQRSARATFDVPRSGSFVHPFVVGHSSGGRSGSSDTPPMIPPYPGSAARARDRVLALQAYFQQPSSSPPRHSPVLSGSRRSTSHGGLTQVGPLPSASDQAGGFYIFPSGTSNRNFPEADNPMPGRFHAWERDHLPFSPLSQIERDSTWGVFHQASGGSTSFRQQHGSEWAPSSQNRP
ncbi:hypothetical protein Nepgr_012283 [Nepenthes gracilis]|uniref:RING-type domain-containing protein n=1 Tax=Nepenthes gracilis TaxID=150966 RepID=A0AAD3SH24_NEPGR|nr:hypothetical protein Nepgr_012283 [Nepenthes gracilis]